MAMSLPPEFTVVTQSSTAPDLMTTAALSTVTPVARPVVKKKKKKKVQARLRLATKARTTAGTRRDTRLGGATAAGTSACPEWPEAIVRLWVETSG